MHTIFLRQLVRSIEIRDHKLQLYAETGANKQYCKVLSSLCTHTQWAVIIGVMTFVGSIPNFATITLIPKKKIMAENDAL